MLAFVEANLKVYEKLDLQNNFVCTYYRKGSMHFLKLFLKFNARILLKLCQIKVEVSLQKDVGTTLLTNTWVQNFFGR